MLRLVKAFLKAGILTELGDYEDTHTGTPQGGILSRCWPTLRCRCSMSTCMRRGSRADRCRPATTQDTCW